MRTARVSSVLRPLSRRRVECEGGWHEKTDPDSLIRDQGVEVFEGLLNKPGCAGVLIGAGNYGKSNEVGRLRVVKAV